MARRRSTVKLDSSSVQGDGSYVEFRKFTYGERNALRDKFAELRKEEKLDAIRNASMDLVIERLVGWDWADEDSKPLELPKEYSDLDALMEDEFDFLFDRMSDILSGEDLDSYRKN